MRKELATQLDEFLEKGASMNSSVLVVSNVQALTEGPPFIDTLFTVLRTKSYLPYAPASPVLPSYASSTPSADTGIPIPLDALMAPTESNPSNSAGRGTKRSMEGDDRDGRPPKGMRLNNDGPIPRYTNGRGGGSDGRGWGGPGDRKGRPGPGGHGRGVNGSPGQMNGRPPQTYLPPEQKRGICRDYHSTC
jgi:RNA-binding protein 26